MPRLRIVQRLYKETTLVLIDDDGELGRTTTDGVDSLDGGAVDSSLGSAGTALFQVRVGVDAFVSS